MEFDFISSAPVVFRDVKTINLHTDTWQGNFFPIERPKRFPGGDNAANSSYLQEHTGNPRRRIGKAIWITSIMEFRLLRWLRLPLI